MGYRFPATLFESGTGGTGKTTFVRLTAKILDARVVTINAIDACPIDIAKAIADHEIFLPQRLFVFIEEWNTPNKKLDYFLRPFIEEDRILVDGFEYSCHFLDSISIIIASNDKSVLPQPLLSRMDRIKMVDYSKEELYQIAVINSKDIKIDPKALREIADRSRGVPRTIIRVLNACNRRYTIKGNTLTKDDAINIMENLDIYQYGLNSVDIKILKMLDNHDCLSLTALCGMTGESMENIRYQESLLLELGFLEITNKRRITIRGRGFLRDIK